MKQKTWPRWFGDVLSLFAGGLLPLAFSPLNFYPLAILSLAVLFYFWTESSPRLAAWRGWLFGMGLFGVGVSWVFVAIHVFGQSGLIVSTVLTALFVSFLASYIGLLGWLIKRVSPQASPYSLLLLFPVCWVIFEAFKGWFLSGFPWLEVGVSQIEGPLAGYIPMIGVLGVSLITAFCASLLVYVLTKKSILAAMAIAGIGLTGLFLKQIEWTQPVDKPIYVTMIQGNVPQDIKWDPEQLLNTLDLYKKLTEQHWDSDLIVWPENAVPAFYHQLKPFYLDPLQVEAKANKTDLIIGLPVMDQQQGQYYNSLLALGETAHFYHKRHLVPFGDYVPFAWLRGVLSFFNLPMSAFVPGPTVQPLLHAAGQPIASSICYEDVFSSEVLDALPEATLLVNATNNAWYGDSFAPHQHLQISRSRALETGRPLIRVTTNGISAFVSEKGQIEQRTPQFERSVISQTVQPRQGATPYVLWHYWPLIGLVVFMLGLWAYHRPRTN